MKKYTIQDLSEGRVAVINDGNLEELTKVLKIAFPKEINKVTGAFAFYRVSTYDINFWRASGTTELPTQSVKDFLKELEKWEPQLGEKVEVSNDNLNWYKRVFISKLPKEYLGETNFIYVSESNIDFTSCKYVRQIKQQTITELTLQDIADKFELEVSQIKIIN